MKLINLCLRKFIFAFIFYLVFSCGSLAFAACCNTPPYTIDCGSHCCHGLGATEANCEMLISFFENCIEKSCTLPKIYGRGIDATLWHIVGYDGNIGYVGFYGGICWSCLYDNEGLDDCIDTEGGYVDLMVVSFFKIEEVRSYDILPEVEGIMFPLIGFGFTLNAPEPLTFRKVLKDWIPPYYY